MIDLDPREPYALWTAVAVVAGLVRGFAGFGGPAVLILAMTHVMNPAAVVLKIVLIDVMANSYLVPSTFREVKWHTAGPLTIATLLTMPLGMLALEALDPVFMKRAIALVVGVCTLILLRGWRYRRRPGTGVLLVVGAICGVVFGASYLILILVVFLLAGPDDAATTRANIIIWAFCMAAAFLAVHALLGTLVWAQALPWLALGLVYALASLLGSNLFRRAGEERYRRFVLWLLVALAATAIVG